MQTQKLEPAQSRQHSPASESAQLKKQNSGMHLIDNRSQSVQRKANTTGLPDNLKSGIENLSGHSMDDVKVHYNSSQPAQLNAHAYAQGNQIHLASGQEKHLPHEAWHVVQQKQGRVQPTKQMKGKVNINDDKGLEKEADVMGAKALQMVTQLKCNACEKEEKEKATTRGNVTQRYAVPIQMVTCAPSNHNPGDADHKRVQEKIVADEGWEMERKVNDGVACAGGTDRYIDLINANLDRVYEVKPRGQEAAARAEATLYKGWVGTCCGKAGVQEGGKKFTREADMGEFGTLCYKSHGQGAITYSVEADDDCNVW